MLLTFRSSGVVQTTGVGMFRSQTWDWTDLVFMQRALKTKNLKHGQNVEPSCALSKNRPEQKGFQAVRCQQVYYQNQNSQRCNQTVWATTWADRKFWFTAGISGTEWELMLPYLGNFQVFLLITRVTLFLLYAGAYHLPWHISKLLGLWIAALCFGYKTFKLYVVQEVHHPPVALL